LSNIFKYSKISDIDSSINQTWDGSKIFLTFDIDWAHDEVIADLHFLLDKYGVQATIFTTHSSLEISSLMNDPKFEVGLHPNFNSLLDGISKNENAKSTITNLKDLFPKATSVRSHSITTSSVISSYFAAEGITHDVNFFVPDHANIELKPWLSLFKVNMIPYFWEDDVACVDNNVNDVSQLVNRKGIKVFDFHPIHVFLNTESLNRYENTRPLHQKPKELIKHRFDGYGTRSRLIKLLKLHSRK
jgi:hypothetical protein